MKRTIQIALGDDARSLGAIHYNQEGGRENAVFEYDPAWLAAPDRFTIDPALQLVGGGQFHRKAKDGSIFHPAIADTEPDGWGRRVIQRDHAKRRQEARRTNIEKDIQPLNDLDYLLAVDDVSRVGALRLKDEDGVFQRPFEEARRTTPPLVELAPCWLPAKQSKPTRRRRRISLICAGAERRSEGCVQNAPSLMTAAGYPSENSRVSTTSGL